MKWISNTDARRVETARYYASRLSTQERRWYWRWRNQFVEGPPQATSKYSQDELIAMGMVGLYRDEGHKQRNPEKVLRRIFLFGLLWVLVLAFGAVAIVAFWPW